MSFDLRQADKDGFPYYYNFTATTATTEVLLPSTAKSLKIGSPTNSIYHCQNGATDGGTLPTNRGFAPAGNYMPITLGIGRERKSIFVAVQSGTGEISVILEE